MSATTTRSRRMFRLLVLLGIVLCAFGAYNLGHAGYLAYTIHTGTTGWTHTTGEVERLSGEASRWQAAVRYADHQGQVRFKDLDLLGTGARPFHEGDQLMLVYPPDRPEEAQIDQRAYLWNRIDGPLFLGGILFFGGAILALVGIAVPRLTAED